MKFKFTGRQRRDDVGDRYVIKTQLYFWPLHLQNLQRICRHEINQKKGELQPVTLYSQFHLPVKTVMDVVRKQFITINNKPSLS